MGIASCYVILYTFLFIFRCNPLDQGWDITVTTGTCLNSRTIMTVLSVANIVMDVLTLLLPIPVIMRLQMRLAQRISVILIFSSGIFVCAIAIKRTLQMFTALSAADYTWVITEQFYWSYIEVNAGILCATVPALKPFAKRHLANAFSSFRQYHGKSGRSAGPTDQDDAIMLRLTPKRASYSRF